jgi:hypothetical protein
MLCVKIVLKKYIKEVHFVFALLAQKQNEPPKIFSVHDFDAKHQRVNVLSSSALHQLMINDEL